MKPISLLQSSSYFAIPGVAMFVGFYFIVPYMHQVGVSTALAFLLFLWGSTILLIPLSIFLYVKEGNVLTWESFQHRFRLVKPTKKQWKLIIIIFIVSFISDGLLGDLGKLLAQIPFLTIPAYFTAPFHPLKELLPFTHFFDLELKGQWWVLLVFPPLHMLSMIGEELMWRGYILPRQEITYGPQKAWIINALQWGYIVHFFMFWNFIGFLPSMLLTTWIAAKTKSTYASLFVHAVSNSFLWVLLLLGIMGI